MTKIDFAQINGVAVTAFVFCLVVGALLSVTMHQPAPIIVGGIAGPVPAVRNQSGTANGRRLRSCAWAVTSVFAGREYFTSFLSWRLSAHSWTSAFVWPM